ncbi:MAG: DUF4352 domain-containing protein [Lachnospiraceae bacterium]|nr:DUF4352 domain-containing protein [Lachnospiraceae bacterium]
MKKIIIVTAAILMALALSACTVTPKDKDSTAKTTAAPTSVKAGQQETTADKADSGTTAAPETTPAATEAPTTPAPTTTVVPVKEAFQVGDTVSIKDLTFVYVASGEYESDNQFLQPADGNKYIFLEFYVEYNGKGNTSVSSFDFEGYADGYSVDKKYSFDNELSGSISSGRWNQGRIYFEVPQDATKIEAEYDVNLFTDEVIKFVYEGEQNSGFVPEKKIDADPDALVPGGTVETKELKITYLDCGVAVSDNQFLQPAEGYKYIYFELEFENISSREQSVSSLLFNCYADGKYCESHLMVRDDDLSATLSSGRKTKGSVVFEVPEDATVIELEYETSLISGKFIVFSYVNK